MWIFLSAGLLYLTGVAVVLFVKPEYMFTPDGQWKEFGIGQNPDRYTAFPFWLFCIAWAVISYVFVLILSPLFKGSKRSQEEYDEIPLPKRNRRNINQALVEEEYNLDEVLQGREVGLPRGYYILNRKATRIAGTPKYVYLGPEADALGQEA